MARAVKDDELSNPVAVGVFGAMAEVPEAAGLSHLAHEAEWLVWRVGSRQFMERFPCQLKSRLNPGVGPFARAVIATPLFKWHRRIIDPARWRTTSASWFAAGMLGLRQNYPDQVTTAPLVGTGRATPRIDGANHTGSS